MRAFWVHLARRAVKFERGFVAKIQMRSSKRLRLEIPWLTGDARFGGGFMLWPETLHTGADKPKMESLARGEMWFWRSLTLVK